MGSRSGPDPDVLIPRERRLNYNMNRLIALSRAKSAAIWLAKRAVVAVPAALLAKLSQAVETLIDARAPAWKRAAAAIVVIELAELLPAVPASLVLRFIILRAVFEAGARPVTMPVDASR